MITPRPEIEHADSRAGNPPRSDDRRKDDATYQVTQDRRSDVKSRRRRFTMKQLQTLLILISMFVAGTGAGLILQTVIWGYL